MIEIKIKETHGLNVGDVVTFDVPATKFLGLILRKARTERMVIVQTIPPIAIPEKWDAMCGGRAREILE